MPAERPTRFSETLAAEICRRLAAGELLRDICRPTRMPGRDTVHRWLAENGQFRSQYGIARDHMADALAEEAVHIARNATASTASARRLQVDTIKWLTAKLVPKRYGEKVVADMAARTSIGDAIEKGRERVRRLRTA